MISLDYNFVCSYIKFMILSYYNFVCLYIKFISVCFCARMDFREFAKSLPNEKGYEFGPTCHAPGDGFLPGGF